jgi:hypothetical protein
LHKRDCFFYNWGGNSARGYTSYPRELGARCEKREIFFTTGDECINCKDYQKGRTVGTDLFDAKLEEEFAKLGDLRELLKKACPNGHPAFTDMAVRAAILHSLKNKDYAGGGAPLGNFIRRSKKASAYKTGEVHGIDLSDPVQIMLWDMEKQLDAAWWLRVKHNRGAVEGEAKRIWDVVVYGMIALCRILDEEKESMKLGE